MDCGLEAQEDGLAKKLGLTMTPGEGAGQLVAWSSSVYVDVAVGYKGQGNVCLDSCSLSRSPSWCSDCHPLTAGMPGDEDKLR